MNKNIGIIFTLSLTLTPALTLTLISSFTLALPLTLTSTSALPLTLPLTLQHITKEKREHTTDKRK